MYAAEARKFIEKLIQMQKVIEQKGYQRTDQAAVRQSRDKLKKQLDFFPYKTDEQMRGFFDRNQEAIKTLIPGESHPAFAKLMKEYITLKNQ
jgi:hypothetical protein